MRLQNLTAQQDNNMIKGLNSTIENRDLAVT